MTTFVVFIQHQSFDEIIGVRGRASEKMDTSHGFVYHAKEKWTDISFNTQ